MSINMDFFRFLLSKVFNSSWNFNSVKSGIAEVFYMQSLTPHPWVKINMSKVLLCLLLLAYITSEIVFPLLLPFKGAAIKISFAKLSETERTKSRLTCKPALSCVWTGPSVAAPLHVVGNESRLGFLFLDSPEVFIMQDVGLKSNKDVSSAVCLSTWLFFSQLWIQTCCKPVWN